jgi:hypothetical protein
MPALAGMLVIYPSQARAFEWQALRSVENSHPKIKYLLYHVISLRLHSGFRLHFISAGVSSILFPE